MLGVISDTHGILRPEAVAALAGSELIIHAGDIGSPEVLKQLREIAPVIAVRGNMDRTLDMSPDSIALSYVYDFVLSSRDRTHDLHQAALSHIVYA